MEERQTDPDVPFRLRCVERVRSIGADGVFEWKIDTTHALTSYEADKVEPAEESVWQRRVVQSLDFDPEAFYPEVIQYLGLTPGVDNLWKLITRNDLRKRDQQGHQSLREKYGKDHWDC